MNTESLKIDSKEEKRIFDSLSKLGLVKKADPNPYLKWKLSNGVVTVMLYSSMKLVIQGNVDLSSVLALITNREGQTLDYIPHIGADEVGKGDYFGPLIVCACYVPVSAYPVIQSLGVTDSKKLSDKKILELYAKIKELVTYRIATLKPSQYNTDYQQYLNVAKLLAKMHGDNIRSLISELKTSDLGYSYVVIDQFSSNKGRLESELKGVEFKQMHHAESLDLPTATASIIARRYFLNSFDEMSDEYGFDFPLGSVHVVEKGREFVKKFGRDELSKVAKISFRTTQQVLI